MGLVGFCDVVAERAVCRYLSYYRANYRALGFRESLRTVSELVERVVFHVGFPKTGTSAIQRATAAACFCPRGESSISILQPPKTL